MSDIQKISNHDDVFAGTDPPTISPLKMDDFKEWNSSAISPSSGTEDSRYPPDIDEIMTIRSVSQIWKASKRTAGGQAMVSICSRTARQLGIASDTTVARRCRPHCAALAFAGERAFTAICGRCRSIFQVRRRDGGRADIQLQLYQE